MSNPFFDQPILNSPYACPQQHWELDDDGQPTQRTIPERRKARFIAPIPKPKKRKRSDAQDEMVFDEGRGLSTKEQQYDPTSIINEVRGYVHTWRNLPSPSQWQVTPETQRLLLHWRHHMFSGVRPFFCQVEVMTEDSKALIISIQKSSSPLYSARNHLLPPNLSDPASKPSGRSRNGLTAPLPRDWISSLMRL